MKAVPGQRDSDDVFLRGLQHISIMADDVMFIDISGVMTKAVVKVNPEMNVKEVAGLLKSKNMGLKCSMSLPNNIMNKL